MEKILSMSLILDHLTGSVESALDTLIEYVSFHVLLCLVPAFFIAGALTVFIPTESIMKYLGPDAKGIIAYPIAAIGGLILAVCSCTVIPLFVGIYKKGVGLGPAMTFLFAAPAVNILAITYTGSLIGMEIAIARAILAISFSIIIGILMDAFFPNKTEGNANLETSNKGNPPMFQYSSYSFAITLIVLLNVFSGIMLVLIEDEGLLFVLYAIGLVSLIYLSTNVSNKESILFLWLVFALFVGTSRIEPYVDTITIGSDNISASIANMLVKSLLAGIVAVGIVLYAKKYIQTDDLNEWLQETWIFVKSIFPLIIAGVVIAGAVKYFVPEDVIISLVGSNTILANFVAVFFGVFMYFPTLMEVPIAKTFLDLGMAKGPLLAYLLADPELSIQSILVTRKYLGDKKNSVYVILVAILTTIAGLIFGLYLNEGFGVY
jgi:uncharacterized membrane protein YraQ (UPF0718 family)